MNADLLNEVFRFKFKRPSTNQEVATCESLLQHFCEFVATIEPVKIEGFAFSLADPLVDDRKVPLHQFAVDEHRELNRICEVLTCAAGTSRAHVEHIRGDVWIEKWYPKYGCALQMEMTSVSRITLRLVFPDAWEHVVHFLPGSECVHTAVPRSTGVLNCGAIRPDLMANFVIRLKHELNKAKARTGADRSAAKNPIGHQKTPQFIAALIGLVRATMGSYTAGDTNKVVVRGGTTDVGLHTGGSCRDTCWSLVHAVIHQNLPGCGIVADKALMLFLLSLLMAKSVELKSMSSRTIMDESQFWATAEDAFAMLQTVVLQVVEHAQRGYNADGIESRCAEIRDVITRSIAKVNESLVAMYSLPTAEAFNEMWQSMKCPQMSRVIYKDAFKQSMDDYDVVVRAHEQISSVDFVDVKSGSTGMFTAWLASTESKTGSKGVGLVVLRAIEDFLSARSSILLERTEHCNVDCTIEDLRYILSIYGQRAREWDKSSLSHALFDVEQRSRELVVKWLGFCLAHRLLSKSHDLLSNYGIALDWQHLSVAVLKEQAAIDALGHVASYIRTWNRIGRAPLFDLNNQTPTTQFARSFALHSEAHLTLYAEETKRLEKNVAAKWNEVLGKKQTASNLRAEIQSINASIAHYVEILSNEEAELAEENKLCLWSQRRKGTREIRQYRHQIHQLTTQIGSRERHLLEALQVPFTVNSLPEDKAFALEVLFFLHVPTDIAILGDLCVSAQQALASRDSSPGSTLLERVPDTTWLKHYKAYSSARDLQEQLLTACPTSFNVPRSHGPSSIDSLSDKYEYAHRCVWYPPGGGTRIYWSCLSGYAVNPFTISREMMIQRFTHKLPAEFQSLQWAIAHPGGEKRGNLVYSKLRESYPDDFDQDSFIQFGQLRAFPNQQVRKICCAVKDDSLPWHHPCVKAVVRQAMYQVGELADETIPCSVWKADMQSVEGLAIFCSVLDRAASKLDRTPRNFEDVPLLSELAAFVSQHTGKAREVVSKFVHMCQRWARDVRKQYVSHNGISSQVLSDLRSKECLLYGYALQGFTLGELRDADLLEMGKLVMLFRNSMLYAGGSALWPELQKMDSMVTEIMARRTPELVAFVLGNDSNLNQTLTTLLQVVNHSAPNNLAWASVKPTYEGRMSASFTAYDRSTQTHVAIDLFTGSILTDGNSPGGLPAQIRASKRFQDLFGEQDFEVTCSKGVYRTSYPIHGCYLEFSLPGSELHIREVSFDVQKQIVKRLELYSLEWRERLLSVLPIRVVEMHSLWFWVEKNCILARSPRAFDKEVAFVVTFGNGDASDVVSVQCFQLRMTDKKASHLAIMNHLVDCDSFVSVSKSFTRVLQKLESSPYIHVLRDPSGCVKINLPRFRLTFVLDTNCGLLRSLEYEGYVLDQTQQLDDAFPNFSRYLVLCLVDAAVLSKPQLRIITPAGKIVRNNVSGSFDIAVSAEPSAILTVAVFDVHRRLGTLTTESTVSRLQLCALLASTGLIIPSNFLKMTGAEAALKFMRGCYISHSFSAGEKQSLLDICAFGHREPALKILASSLLQKSTHCLFLAGESGGGGGAVAIDCANELDAYCAMCVQHPERNALRVRLDPVEEQIILGSVLQCGFRGKWVSTKLVDLDPAPVNKGFVTEIEAKLLQLLVPGAEPSATTPALPIKQLENDVMGTEMNVELLESWRTYHEYPDACLIKSPEVLLSTFQTLLDEVRSKRYAQEQYIFKSIKKVQDGSISNRLLATINYAPAPTLDDVIRSSIDPEVFLLLAPELSHQGRSDFKAMTLVLMELCVLEDKLERLVVSTQQEAPLNYIVDELSSRREWSSEEYPFWLAFEVEGRLQIRHEQYVVAKHLIENPGSVCQMNMGRGKTRVILPMLFLYFSHRHRGDKVVRAHFLTPLLSETRQFMHRYLSASSTLGLNFIELPFHRNVELDLFRLQLILEAVEEAKLCGKFLLMAPEHRMSLELKRLDLLAATQDDDNGDSVILALNRLLDSEHYIDVLDESDAILHHKYHLVYAVGVPQKLLCGDDRWFAVEALFRIVNNESRGSRAREVLRRPHVSFQCPEYVNRFGGYNGLRLYASVENKGQIRAELRRALALDLMDDQSSSLLWLRTFSDHGEETQEQLVQAITDPTVNLDEAIAGIDTGVSRFRDRLLALRGLIALGILEYCLEKRHRVEYGLPDPGTRKKRMAIPFRAADIPSERSEFSHPEVGITLTILAYYHKGLDKRELKEALQQLLLLGVSEQSSLYRRWYGAVKAKLSPDAVMHLPTDAHQLSPNDSRQFALLHETFRFTTETINFFLNKCVFPNDTTQYPHRLSRSAWNLAGGDWNIGFSGTNDNHRLLPLSVRQHEPDQPSLLGTNGKMIDRIIQVSRGYEVIWTSELSTVTPWQVLLRLAMEKRAHALIDTGALLAGVLNNDAAVYLLESSGFHGFAGVTYYDTRRQFDCWVVLDAISKHVTPLKKATILEKDTFVIFDDARSRGSDMKLNPDAVAVLTLGPKLTKDKLMQGAGRMRQLGCGQTLWLVSLDEVAQSVLQVCGKDDETSVETADILDWVMDSTKSAVVHGLIEWASSGLHFSKTRNDSDAELSAEDWSLESLYSFAHRPELISNIVRSKLKAIHGDCGANLDDLAAAICERSCKYGLDDEVLVVSHNEECEREFHIEQFEERVRVTEEKHFLPSSEQLWDYSRLLTARNACDLGSAVEIVKLSDFVEQRILPRNLCHIRWDKTQVFGTTNFFTTVVTAPCEFVNELTRVADVMLLFTDGSVLLLSEYEADQVLNLLWQNANTGKAAVRFRMMDLTFVVDAVEEHGDHTLVTHVSWGSGCSIDIHDAHFMPSLAAACQLFNGEAMFTKKQTQVVKVALRALLQPLKDREAALQEFIASREHLLKWPQSLLHELCHEMDLQDMLERSRACNQGATARMDVGCEAV